MADEVKLLTAEEVAAIRVVGVHWCGPDTFDRLCATLEALMQEIGRLKSDTSGTDACGGAGGGDAGGAMTLEKVLVRAACVSSEEAISLDQVCEQTGLVVIREG